VKIRRLVQKFKVLGAGDTDEPRRLSDLMNLLIRSHVRRRTVCVCYQDLHPEYAHIIIKHKFPVVIQLQKTVDCQELQSDQTEIPCCCFFLRLLLLLLLLRIYSQNVDLPAGQC
jgi:hypothetical protein